jgi:hypothetical protein
VKETLNKRRAAIRCAEQATTGLEHPTNLLAGNKRVLKRLRYPLKNDNIRALIAEWQGVCIRKNVRRAALVINPHVPNTRVVECVAVTTCPAANVKYKTIWSNRAIDNRKKLVIHAYGSPAVVCARRSLFDVIPDGRVVDHTGT